MKGSEGKIQKYTWAELYVVEGSGRGMYNKVW